MAAMTFLDGGLGGLPGVASAEAPHGFTPVTIVRTADAEFADAHLETAVRSFLDRDDVFNEGFLEGMW
ncbi:hypothetical protein CDD83_5783 [Cordyceps sp. RAO-2017]|nr:hypothetical protein CDD83_5783 [Cordyceps sp. RAO-2017]